MTRTPLFAHTSIAFQLLIFLGLLLMGALLSMLISLVISALVFGLNFNEVGEAMQAGGPLAMQSGRLLQVVSQLGIFIMPPLVLALLVHPSLKTYLGFNGKAKPVQYVLFVLLMFACLPLIHELAELNKSIRLPESMAGLEAWMHRKEDEAAQLTEFFLGVSTIKGLAFNLFMIAVLPSVGEELVFRSVLQPKLGRLLRNAHVGVIISALLFSMMHLQFYGLIPRFVLGLFLGYAYLWTRSIWVPILMHFVNNAAAVIVYFLAHNGHIPVSMDDFGGGGGTTMLVLSIAFCIAILWASFMFSYKKEPQSLH